jgi:hypothetical protein
MAAYNKVDAMAIGVGVAPLSSDWEKVEKKDVITTPIFQKLDVETGKISFHTFAAEGDGVEIPLVRVGEGFEKLPADWDINAAERSKMIEVSVEGLKTIFVRCSAFAFDRGELPKVYSECKFCRLKVGWKGSNEVDWTPNLTPDEVYLFSDKGTTVDLNPITTVADLKVSLSAEI